MIRAFIISIVVTFFATPTFAQISSPPADNLVDQLKAEGSVQDIQTPAVLLAAETVIKSERLSRSEVTVLETTKTFDDTGFQESWPAQSTSYESVFEVPDFGPDQGTITLSRILNPEEVARLRAGTVAPPEAMALGLKAYGGGLLMVGGTLSQMVRNSGMDSAIGGNIGSAGVNQSGNLALNPDEVLGNSSGCDFALDTLSAVHVPGQPGSTFSVDPWESVDPFFFLLGPACMVMQVAERMGVDLGEEAEALAAAQRAVAESASLQSVSEDMVGNRVAFKIEAEGLGLSQPMSSPDLEDTPFEILTINKMSLWIDAAYFVRLKMRMEGVIEQDGESREIFLEQQYADYQTVPETYLYEPYREIFRVGGMFSPAQQAEMQEAVRKIDEYEKQMASMPASQRAMMERMLGSKMEQMRSMASGGAIEIRMITTSIVVNPDLTSPVLGMDPGLAEANLVQIIQGHLFTLGYDPGKKDGELIRQTVVAITQFEAKNSMPVTGQATPQLAGILAATVDALH